MRATKKQKHVHTRRAASADLLDTGVDLLDNVGRSISKPTKLNFFVRQPIHLRVEFTNIEAEVYESAFNSKYNYIS